MLDHGITLGRSKNRWRTRVKAALASTISRTHDLGLADRIARGPERPLILGYHRIVDDFRSAAQGEMPSMLTGVAMFERHLDAIGRHFRFASLDDIADRLASGEPFTEHVAAVTFDDGYRDVYEQAFPVLRRKGIPAAVFVVTDLVGRPFWQIHDKLYHLVAKGFATWGDPRRELWRLLASLGLPATQLLRHRSATRSPLMTVSALLPDLSQTQVTRVMAALEASIGNGFHQVPQTLTWPMLEEMRAAGFTIGSHTRTHISLPAESMETVFTELEGSKREIEQQLRVPVRHFAYPGGQFTPRDVDALERAGYKYGYTACPHGDQRHPLLTIERLLLWEGSSVDGEGRFSPDILHCQIHDLWPPARTCARTHDASGPQRLSAAP
jgi:peptidoglycan/xylan/chitin deacetylase (PgdA/CDA1 family)